MSWWCTHAVSRWRLVAHPTMSCLSRPLLPLHRSVYVMWCPSVSMPVSDDPRPSVTPRSFGLCNPLTYIYRMTLFATKSWMTYNSKFKKIHCNIHWTKPLALRRNKKCFVSGYPTDPNFYMPTLIFFLDKRIIPTSVMDKTYDNNKTQHYCILCT